jgi:8-amino-7-oxononanoate synthase
MVSGFQSPHEAFESAFSAHVGQEASLLFNSGYHANLAVIQALLNKSKSNQNLPYFSNTCIV